MKRILSLSFFLFFIGNVFGQNADEFNYHFKNATGRKIDVIDTWYSQDSTETFDYSVSPKDDGFSVRQTGPFNYIRLDVLALDDSTKDTLFVKSYSKEELSTLDLTIEKGEINKIIPLTIAPKLMMKAKDFEKIVSLNDTIDVRLIDKEKIKGRIVFFDRDSLTLIDEKNIQHKISKKEIDGIKMCGGVLNVGGGSIGIENCKYHDLENLHFKLVKKEFILSEKSWKWVEIK